MELYHQTIEIVICAQCQRCQFRKCSPQQYRY